MLRGGEVEGVRVLSPAMVALMTREVTAPVGAAGGIGWNANPLAADHYALGLGHAARGHDRLAAGVRPRRRLGHEAVDRPGLRPRLRLPHRFVGYPTAPIDAVQAAIYAALS